MDPDLLRKHGIVLDGKQRRYWYPLPDKLFDLEFTSPEYLIIGGEKLKASSWGDLLLKMVKYLLEIYPDQEKNLILFKTDWSKQLVFSQERRTNYVDMGNGFYLNTNHTSLHLVWLLIDLLGFFGVNYSVCKLLIHRMPRAESSEIKEAVTAEVKEGLKIYLARKQLISSERIEKIMKNFDYINRLFQQMKSGYNDIYLFDDASMFGLMKNRFISDFSKKDISPDKKKTAIVKRLLGYLADYYRDNGYYHKKEA